MVERVEQEYLAGDGEVEIGSVFDHPIGHLPRPIVATVGLRGATKQVAGELIEQDDQGQRTGDITLPSDEFSLTGKVDLWCESLRDFVVDVFATPIPHVVTFQRTLGINHAVTEPVIDDILRGY